MDELREDLLRRIDLAYDPLSVFCALPDELRSDAEFIARTVGLLALTSNTTELARHVGMSRMGLRKAMAEGANPSFATMVNVARALGLRFDVRPAA